MTTTMPEKPVEADPLERTSKRPLLLSLSLGVVAVLSIFYFKQLSRQCDYFISDHTYFFQPLAHYIGERLRAGQWPLWNPYVYCGMSQIAVPSPGVFYPFTWLFAFLDYSQCVAVIMASHQLIAFVGGFLLVESFGWGIAPALIFACCVAFNGYMFSLVSNQTLPMTASWLPLTLWSFRTLVTTNEKPQPDPGRRRARSHALTLLSAATLFMLVACGRPEVSAPSIIVVLAWILIHSKSGIANGALRWQLVAVTIAALLSAVVVLPLLEWGQLSPRKSGLGLGEALMWSSNWYDFVCMLFVQPFGDLQMIGNPLLPLVTTRQLFLPFTPNNYIGPVVLTLAMWGMFDRSWRHRWSVIAALTISLIMSLGEYTPIVPFLFTHIKALSVFRFPIKWLIFLIFAIAALAARGIYLLQQKQLSRLSLRTACGVWIGGTLGGAGLWLFGNARQPFLWSKPTLTPMAESLLGSAIVPGCLIGLAVCALAVLGMRGTLSFKRAVFLIGAGVPVSLLLAAAATAQKTVAYGYFHSRSCVFDKWREVTAGGSDGRRLATMFFDPVSFPDGALNLPSTDKTIAFFRYCRELMLPNTNVSRRVPETFGYEAGASKFYIDTFLAAVHKSAISVQIRKDGRKEEVEGDLPLSRICRATATNWIVTQIHQDNGKRIQSLDSRYFAPLMQNAPKNVQIYQVKNPLPRAYFAANWKWTDDQDEVKRAFSKSGSMFDPGVDTFINRQFASGHLPNSMADPFAPKLAAPPTVAPPRQEPLPDGAATVSILQDRPEHVSVSVRTVRPGFVILADRFYPGWQALVDSVPRLIYQANVEARAVYVPAGAHLIEFNYQPDSLRTGYLLTSLGMMFCLFLLASSLWPFIYRSIKAMAGQASD